MAIEMIDKIKPKNNGNFAVVDAIDVEMADGTRLEEAIKNVQGTGYVVRTEPPEDTRLLWIDPSDNGPEDDGSGGESGDESEDISAALEEIDTLIGGGG